LNVVNTLDKDSVVKAVIKVRK